MDERRNVETRHGGCRRDLLLLGIGRSVGRSTSAVFKAMLMGNGKDHSPLGESPRNKATFESRIYLLSSSPRRGDYPFADYM
ncbi:hypothetical protein ALC56_11456 [Trachymyrmex septentrionalis]|uniref:Uncharacterized protein n=1 Tax=Trachymyrmex septentrionalis TaxID=34720 RepID=A0A195F2M9_9HYME|nr:hypothetical protein ALC56_11456 [Trachymyrmex septentrionalis]